MKWMYQCRGVSSNWHHLSDVCYGGGVVVSAAVATALLNPLWRTDEVAAKSCVPSAIVFKSRHLQHHKFTLPVVVATAVRCTSATIRSQSSEGCRRVLDH